jgi:hypothetical protein
MTYMPFRYPIRVYPCPSVVKMTKDYLNQGFFEVIDAGVSEIASDAKSCETIRHDCSKLAETQPQRQQRSCRSFYLDNFRYKFAAQFP